ncbi:hypothetical protein [Neobacillus vireti]
MAFDSLYRGRIKLEGIKEWLGSLYRGKSRFEGIKEWAWFPLSWENQV